LDTKDKANLLALQKQLQEIIERYQIWQWHLKVRVNGTAKALFAHVQMLEMRLKDLFDGSLKGFQAIQLHNSAFLKTVQDLNVAGNPISDDRQVCDYLMTIQDPILLPLKDSIRAEGGVQLLEEVQQKFVDIVEGRKADAMAQVKQHHCNIHLTKTPQANQDQKQANKHNGNKKNLKKGGGKTQGSRSDGKKRKFTESLTNEEIKTLKVTNPGNWFLTTKTVPPKSYLQMTFDERSLMKKFREKEARAVKAVRTGVAKDVVATVVAANDELGAQLGPKLMLVTNQPSPIITALNQIGTGNSLVLTAPTVQFGCAAHPAQDEEKMDR
jgi:hypothetical protein